MNIIYFFIGLIALEAHASEPTLCNVIVSKNYPTVRDLLLVVTNPEPSLLRNEDALKFRLACREAVRYATPLAGGVVCLDVAENNAQTNQNVLSCTAASGGAIRVEYKVIFGADGRPQYSGWDSVQ